MYPMTTPVSTTRVSTQRRNIAIFVVFCLWGLDFAMYTLNLILSSIFKRSFLIQLKGTLFLLNTHPRLGIVEKAQPKIRYVPFFKNMDDIEFENGNTNDQPKVQQDRIQEIRISPVDVTSPKFMMKTVFPIISNAISIGDIMKEFQKGVKGIKPLLSAAWKVYQNIEDELSIETYQTYKQFNIYLPQQYRIYKQFLVLHLVLQKLISTIQQYDEALFVIINTNICDAPNIMGLLKFKMLEQILPFAMFDGPTPEDENQDTMPISSWSCCNDLKQRDQCERLMESEDVLEEKFRVLLSDQKKVQ